MATSRALQTLSTNIPIETQTAGSLVLSVEKSSKHIGDKGGLGSEPKGNSLLPEVLRIVFDFLVDETEGKHVIDKENSHLLCGAESRGHVHFKEDFSSLRTLILLSQVNRQWREVVQSSSALWSRINFSRLVAGEGDAAKHQESLRYIMKRCESKPLKMTIALGEHRSAGRRYGGEHVKSFLEIFSAILDEQERLKHLSFDSHICTIVPAPSLWLIDMPLLETLTIRSPVDDSRTEALIDIGLDHSPLLKTLHLDGDFLINPVTKTLSNLKEVRLLYRETFRKEFPSVADCMTILQASPACEVFQADICSNQIPEKMEKVVSSAMRTFCIRVNDESDEAARVLLDAVTFPGLTTLDLDIGRSTFEDSGPHPHILSFVQRCKAPLRTFSFCSEECDELDLMRYLRLMPELRELKLTDVGLTEEGIDLLTLRGGKKSVCPKLEVLEFHDSALRPEPLGSQHEMAFMVVSRFAGASCGLRKLKLKNCGWRGFASHPMMQICIEKGLKMSFR